MEVIQFAWGGCGNFIKQCLTSDTTYNRTVDFYNKLTINKTYVSQEWSIRNNKRYILSHDCTTTGINLVWENTLDTSFHYILKNIVIDHLIPVHDDIIERNKIVIEYNKNLENQLKQHPHIIIDKLLKNKSQLFEFCILHNPKIDIIKVNNIYQLWKSATRQYYDRYNQTVLGYFSKLGIDYSAQNLYNILYENTNT
jgi:hypothetical protein